MPALINGQVLRAAREAKGWNQQTLAQRAGVNKSVVSRLEREMQDDLKVSVLVALATALEISPENLLVLPLREAHTLIPQIAALLPSVAALPEIPQRYIAGMIQGCLAVATDET